MGWSFALLVTLSLISCCQNQCPNLQQCYNVTSCSDGVSLVTTAAGAPVDDRTSSLSVGACGPLLLQDTRLVDELAFFDRERIPERVVHAKGAGAFGYFEVTSTQITQFCRAALFSDVGKRTDVAVRFSTVFGGSGAADLTREPRGFAIKFYTEEGNWDLVGGNSPIFFLRDPILSPSYTRSQKKHPVTHVKDYNSVWDFITLEPQTVYQILKVFSDEGIPDGYRFMNGYGGHTFKLVDKLGHPVYCKFVYTSDQGLRNLTTEQATKINGEDPDYSIRDLYNAIDREEFPSWTLGVQIMTYQQAEEFRWNPFDLTKIWPECDYPLMEVGRLVLNRNPEDYFTEVEQLAFSPGRLIPGIEPSPDRILQARMFAYPDTQRHRLGSNFLQLPVNCPYRVAVHTNHRDGRMCYNNQAGSPNYYPSSFNGPRPDPRGAESVYRAAGDVKRYNITNEDNFSQPGIYWRCLTETQKTTIVNNLVNNIKRAKIFLQNRAVKLFSQVDVILGQRLAQGLQEAQS